MTHARRRLPGVASGLLLAVALTGLGAASPRDDPAPEDRLRRAEEELVRLRREMEALDRREQGILGEIERLDAGLRVRFAELEESRARAEVVALDVAAREERLRVLRIRQANAERWLRLRVRELYKAGPWSEASLLLGVGKATDVWDGVRAAVGAAERDRSAVVRWRETRAEMETELSGLVAEKETLDSVIDSGRRAAERLERDRAGREATVARIRADLGQRAQAVSELEEAARGLSTLTSDVPRGETAVPALDVRKFRGLLDWPLEKARVAAGFGDRMHPRFRTVVPHPGLDLEAAVGATFDAVFDGRVVYAANLRGYGLTALVDHGGGLVSVYAQASALLVSPGQSVVRGQPLGRVGDPAFRGSAGIYFELREAGRPVDPALWLRRR